MNASSPRASELVALEYDRDKRVIELARLLSLASQIEPELIRAMRLQLMPSADAGLEADLWFSTLVQGRDPDAMVLLPDVTELLRQELADVSRRADLHAAWGVVRACHEGQSPMTLLEESATYFALAGTPQDFARMEQELGRALQALEASPDPDLARWVARALPRMPAQVRGSEPALALAQAASRQLGGVQVRGILETGDATPDTWSPGFFRSLPRVTVGLRLSSDGLELSEPPAPDTESIEVPHTNPIVLEIGSPTPQGWDARREAFAPGTVRALEVPIGPAIRVRTVAGDEHRLRIVSGRTRPIVYVAGIGTPHEVSPVATPASGDSRAADRPVDTIVTEANDLGWSVVFSLERDDSGHFLVDAVFLDEDIGPADIGAAGAGPDNVLAAGIPAFLISTRAISDMDATEIDSVMDGAPPSVWFRRRLAEERTRLRERELAATRPLREQVRECLTSLDRQWTGAWLETVRRVARKIAEPAFIEPGTLLGREDVLAGIDEILEGRPFGAVVVKGAAGIGKSAILREYSRRRRVRTPSPAGGPQQHDRTLYYVAEGEGAEVDNALRGVLRDATAGEISGQKPLLIVIDGLDGPDKDLDPISVLLPYLPSEWPAGLHVLTAARHIAGGRSALPTKGIDLDDPKWADSNAEAVRLFWEQARVAFDNRLDRPMIDRAVAVSAGNFRVAEILRRRFEMASPQLIPSDIGSGLEAVGDLLRRDLDRLNPLIADYATDLLSILCVARQPVPLRDLMPPEEHRGEREGGIRDGKQFSDVAYEYALDALAPVLAIHDASSDREALVDRSSLAPIIASRPAHLSLANGVLELMRASHTLAGRGTSASPSVQWAAAYLIKYELFHLVELGEADRAAAVAGSPASLAATCAALGYNATRALVDKVQSLKRGKKRWPSNIEAVLRIFEEQKDWLSRYPEALAGIVHDQLRIIEGRRLDEEAVVKEYGLSDTRLPLELRRALGRLPGRPADGPSPFLGHSLAVTACAVDVSAPRVLSIGRDAMSYEWDLEASALVAAFGPFESTPTAAAMKIDGGRSGTAVVGRADGRLSILRLNEGGAVAQGASAIEQQRELRGHVGAVTTCAIADDGSALLTGGEDGTVRWWSLTSGLHTLVDDSESPVVACGWLRGSAVWVRRDGEVRSALLTPNAEPLALETTALVLHAAVTCASLDSEGFVAGHADGTVSRFGVDGNTTRSVGQPGSRPVLACTAGRAGLAYAVDDRIQCVAASDFASGDSLTPYLLAGHHGQVTMLSFTELKGRDVLISGSADQTLKVWDSAERRELATLGNRGVPSALLNATTNERLLAFPSSDTTIGLYDLEGDSLAPPLTFDRRPAIINFDHDDGSLAVGWPDGRLEWRSGRFYETSNYRFKGHDGAVTAVASRPETSSLITGGMDGVVNFWRFTSQGAGRQQTQERGAPIRCVAVHPSTSPSVLVAVSVADNGQICSWDTDTGRLLERVETDWGRLTTCAFDSSGRHVAIGSADGRVRVVGFPDIGGPVELFEGHTGGINACAFLEYQGGSYWTLHLFSASDDGTLRVWYVDGGGGNYSVGHVGTLAGHTAAVMGCITGPGRDDLVSWSLDRTVKLWSLSREQCIATTYGHAPFVAGAFLPHRRQMAALDASGMVWLLAIQPDRR